ncbi:MAG: SseB family protein, partial [Microcella pacifica]
MSPSQHDSAGQPWEGRHFEPNPNAQDDGTAPPQFLAIVADLREGRASLREVVDVVRECRFLIPLVAVAGETAQSETGRTIDKSQELSIITVSGPDGRAILPVFSSVAAMTHWRPDARPVPADAVRVALAAASENTDRIVIDARGETELVLPRPAVWAIAQQTPWVPAVEDDAVLEAI